MLQKTLTRKVIDKSVENIEFEKILEDRFYFSPKYLKEKAVLIENK
jgi:hypothetical protein